MLNPKEYEIRCKARGRKIEIPSEVVLLTGQRLFGITWKEKLQSRGTIRVLKFFESKECRKDFIEKEELIDCIEFVAIVKKNRITLSKKFKFLRNERTLMICTDDDGIEVMTINHWKMRAMSWSDEIAKYMEELEKSGFFMWKID